MNNENFKTVNINGKDHKLTEYMFGVLEMDKNSPLHCVSEANNSFSIDYWKGCAWQCAYCHVQGSAQDLDENYQMHKRPIPRSNFSIEQIVDALAKHPYFKKDESVISLSTSSTEPFGNPEVTESTLRTMEYFIEKGLKNPFWIVTKADIPKGIGERLKTITRHGNKTMVSMCWAGNPKGIEPQNNRFSNIGELDNTGVTVSWYLRPLVEEWSANPEQLEAMFKRVNETCGNRIDMIIPGGMRWTEGIEYGIKELRGLKMPNLTKEHNKKTLSPEIEKTIQDLCQVYFPGKPVYFNSSCGISHMLKSSNIALLDVLEKNICDKSVCHNRGESKCKKKSFSRTELDSFENALKKQGIDLHLESIGADGIQSVPPFDTFSYTVQQQAKKTIASEINCLGRCE